jgi:hypothetical protein
MSAIAYGRTSSGLWGDPGVGADDDPGAAPDHGPHQGAGHLHEGRDDRRQRIPATVRGMQVETNVPLAARSAMNLRVGSQAVRGEKRRVLHSVESSFAGSDDADAPVGVCCDRQPVQCASPAAARSSLTLNWQGARASREGPLVMWPPVARTGGLLLIGFSPMTLYRKSPNRSGVVTMSSVRCRRTDRVVRPMLVMFAVSRRC